MLNFEPAFYRYIGIDYSGAETPDSSCRGLRVYAAEGIGTPEQIQPLPSPRRYWTRRGLAEWLCNELGNETPTIVGIHHGFSFPIEYFDRYRLPRDWPSFLLDVQGSVAKSTFAGLPWLLYMRNECKRPIHFWPFDGWDVPQGKSVVAEVYPSLWTRRFPKESRDGDEQAAYAVAAWLQRADQSGSLGTYFNPPLTPEERETAAVEGWILGSV